MSPDELLADELWEAYAARNQTVINFPTLNWEEIDDFTRGTCGDPGFQPSTT